MNNFLALMCLLLLSSRVFSGDILVVVNKNNSTDSLSKSQVVDIFLGRYVAFPSGNSAEPLDIADTELKGDFYQRLTRLNLARVNAYWSRIKFSGKAVKPLQLASEETAIEFVAAEKLAISYIDAESLTEQLKVVYTIDE